MLRDLFATVGLVRFSNECQNISFFETCVRLMKIHAELTHVVYKTLARYSFACIVRYFSLQRITQSSIHVGCHQNLSSKANDLEAQRQTFLARTNVYSFELTRLSLDSGRELKFQQCIF